jgi:hypothetical protein
MLLKVRMHASLIPPAPAGADLVVQGDHKSVKETVIFGSPQLLPSTWPYHQAMEAFLSTK